MAICAEPVETTAAAHRPRRPRPRRWSPRVGKALACRVGDAYDNALAESFWASMQTELLDGRNWHSRDEFRTAVFEYFEYIEVFYNRKRLHSALGYMTPCDFEQQWEAMRQADQKCVA